MLKEWLKDAPCVVLCAGKGTRMGSITPKILLEVGDAAILGHTIEFWQFYCSEFIYVVNEDNLWAITEYTHDWADGKCIVQQEQLGIANAINYVKDCIKDKFVVVLGDCLMEGRFILNGHMEQGIGVLSEPYRLATQQGYSVQTGYNRVRKVSEKPIIEYCGMGVYFFNKTVFEYIRLYPLRDITEIIDVMVSDGLNITPVMFHGKYFNINTPEDLAYARQKWGGIDV